MFSQTERELEKLQLLRDALGDFVIDHVTTRMHKTILGAFGIDANVLRKLNAEICQKLKETDGSR